MTGAQFAPEWHNIEAAVAALGFSFGPPTPGQTWVHPGSSGADEHTQGRAVDFGDATSPSGKIAAALVPYAKGPGAPIDELIFAPLGIGYKNGVNIGAAGYGASTWAEHFNHVHVGVRRGVDLATAVAAAPVPGGYQQPTGPATGGAAGSGVSGFTATLRRVSVEGVLLLAGVTLAGLGAWRAVGGHPGQAIAAKTGQAAKLAPLALA